MFCTFSSTTPRTAQLVVMSGRKMPSAVYSDGTLFLRNISTNCTSTAMTRMKARVLMYSRSSAMSSVFTA